MNTSLESEFDSLYGKLLSFTEPITNGIGSISLVHATYNYIPQPDSFTSLLTLCDVSLMIFVGSPLFSVIQINPLRLQHLVLSIHDGKNIYFASVVSADSFEIDRSCISAKVMVKLLNNFEYIQAVQQERVYWDEC